ncbi:inter-alpha-trypsin inhibitor heavy chain H3-like isoform X2 [Littorina saxatilis]
MKARQQYLEARQTGSTGGLVEQSARHSNKFDVSVNIAAGSNVTFNLIYQELLRRRSGAYEHSVYINPSHGVGEFSVEVYIQERTDIRDVRTPALRKDIINNAVEEEQNTITQIGYPTNTSAHIIYRPSPESLTEQGAGWFVVQYDVDAQDAGQLLVVDGYFVHFFMPPDDLPPLPLDIVFVLDISGSMSGRKIQQLKDAMGIILDDLRSTDRFSILLFDSHVQHWRQTLQEANEGNVETAQNYVNEIKSRGSTDLHKALMRGIELLQGSREASRVPMMFFLTDGEATTGVRDSKQIVDDVSTVNEGVVNIYSLAFGSGADYKLLRQISARNKGFARKIYEASDASKQVSGLYREISTIVMRDLSVAYHSTSNDDNGDDGRELVRVDNRTVTICVLPTLFGKADFVVAGKLDNAEALLTSPQKAGGLTMDITGLGAAGKVNFVLEEDDLTRLTLGGVDPPFWTVPRDLSRITERTWAFLTIKQLLEEKTAAQENAELVKELDTRILDLSLKYHFVTPLTSMVVTRPEDDVNKEKSGEASLIADDEPQAPVNTGRAFLSASHHRQPSRSMSQVSDKVKVRPSSVVIPTSHRRRFGQVSHQAGVRATPSRAGEGAAIAMDRAMYIHHNDPFMFTTSMPFHTTITTKRFKKRGPRKNMKEKGPKNKKRCIVKKMLLQSVIVRDEQRGDYCYELKGARDTHNYTVLADPTANFNVILALRRRLMTSLLVQEGPVFYQLQANKEGDVYFSDSSSASSRAALNSGHYDVIVNVIKKKCRAIFLNVEVKIATVDKDASVVRGYQGFASKSLKSAMKDNNRKRRRSRRRKNKRKVKVAKSCQANNVPADRSYVIRPRQLMRYQF